MNKYLKLLIILAIELSVALLIHVIRSSYWSFQSVSDVLFVVGMVSFFPSLIMVSGAFNVFSGFNYAFRTFFSQNYKEQYPKYRDYLDAKTVSETSPTWILILIVSAFVVVASIILGLM